MPPDADHPTQLLFFDLLPEQFDVALTQQGWPAYRGKQIRDWVFRKGVGDPHLMLSLPRLDRRRLSDQVLFASAVIARRQDSEDGTRKLLLQWPDGISAETVMIPDGPRRTACVSSQAGCPVGCRFCASGIGGLQRSLPAGRIVEQVFALNALAADPAQYITHVVFMGMGESLANYDNVLRAVRILHHPGCFNLSARRITLSTVGVPLKIRQLADEDLPLNLAISLHAPDEALRRRLIPWAEHFPLAEVLHAARYYFDRTGREITLEYILLAGVNDQPEHARKLAGICGTLRANVNLIRYNEVEGLEFKRPVSADVVRFQKLLRANGVNVHLRKSRGRDIDAACGQLRRSQHQEGHTGHPE